MRYTSPSARGGDRVGAQLVGPVVRPRVEERDPASGLRIARAGALRDAGAQERALADAARAVEHVSRERQVRDHVALALAAEEEQRVELGVLERREALVRARRAAFTTARPPRRRAARAERLDVLLERHLEHVDVAAAPELALERLRAPAAPPTSGS